MNQSILSLKKDSEKYQVLKSYGWSESIESQFFQFADKIIGDNYKGNFTIKKSSKNQKWFWYYQFSSTKISPRTKYLCSCDVDTKKGESSFQYATQIFIEKINHDFSNKDVIEPNLSKYIDEYIDVCMEDGGIELKEKGKGGNKYLALVFNGKGTNTKNYSTMKRRIRVLREFKEFCEENKVKTIDVSKGERFRETFQQYFNSLKDRNKRKRDGEIVGDKNLTRATIKLHLQSTRMFLDWLTKPKSEKGRGLIKEHTITSDYQNFLLDEGFGGHGSKSQRIYDDFSKLNYEESVKDCQNYIREIWNLYCKYDGDREKIREERLSYNKKLKDGTLSGSTHKNQPKEMVVMSDVVFFVSFIQLMYGTRITEILKSYRNRDEWEKLHIPTQVSSYFRKVEGDKNDLDYYYLEIVNSKLKDRTIPITDTIYSWTKPPEIVPSKFHPKHTFIMQEGDKPLPYDVWETNIVEVIFELFSPKDHPKTFPSPNTLEKSNKGYSNNYYLNLFKEKLVESDYNWKSRGINSTHHLRSYFVSYMFLQDVRIEDVIEITGHSYQTAMGYYRRINTQLMRDTLQHRDLRNILRKNKI